MKKIVTIKIETDTNHPSKDEWLKPTDFYLNEIDDALDDIRTKGKYCNRSGNVSKATRYTVSVSKINPKQNRNERTRTDYGFVRDRGQKQACDNGYYRYRSNGSPGI